MSTFEAEYRVKILADMANVTADAVRYYTRAGLLNPKRDKYNQYQLFDQHDLLRLQFIRRAKTLGFSINDIKKILNGSEYGKSPCPMVRQVIEKNITKNKQQLIEALALQKRMEDAVKTWGQLPDGVPNGHSICHLIEVVTE